VILCEGYTDVIALHQAGMRNAVGLMGTALTAQQVGELARMAQTVLLALDSDTAGQEAMLKAARLAASRKLELRVVPLPAGADPAELIAAQGGQAVEQAVSRSVPFVRFQVERVLEGGDRDSAEGRDRILDELRPVFAALAQSASRMELLRLVASTLAEQDTLIERELSKPRRQGAGPPAPDAPAARRARGAGLSRREETEHTFLALCIALPDEGERALRELDVEAHFSGELMRRAVRRLRDGSLREPMAAAEGDEDLRPLLAELVVEAGGLGAHPTMLEVQRLQLELARLDRDIQQARGREDADVSALATRRGEVKHDFDVALARRLEETGAREG
jgi:DNA primase